MSVISCFYLIASMTVCYTVARHSRGRKQRGNNSHPMDPSSLFLWFCFISNPASTSSSQILDPNAPSSLASSIIIHHDDGKDGGQPPPVNSLELLQKRAQGILNNASQVFIYSSILLPT